MNERKPVDPFSEINLDALKNLVFKLKQTKGLPILRRAV